MSLTSQVPDAGTPIFDARGYINTVWHEFFFNLLRRTGGSEGNSPEDQIARIIALEILSRDNSAIDSGTAYRNSETYDSQPVDARNHGQHYDPGLHDPVSASANGFMLSSDKQKLDTLVSGAAVASVTATAPISSSGGANPNISIAASSSTTAGSMSASDKAKIDTVVAGAAVASVGATSPLSSTGGGNPVISIGPATQTVPGSMAAADKQKIDFLTSFNNVSVTSTVTVTNTTGDSVFLSAPVIANTPQTGRTIAVKVYGTVSGAASGGTLTFFIKVNGTRFAQVSLTLPASAVSQKGYALVASVTYRSVGTGGSASVSISLVGDSSVVANPQFGFGAAGVDTTAAGQIDVGVNWSSASTSNIAAANNASIVMEKY